MGDQLEITKDQVVLSVLRWVNKSSEYDTLCTSEVQLVQSLLIVGHIDLDRYRVFGAPSSVHKLSIDSKRTFVSASVEVSLAARTTAAM